MLFEFAIELFDVSLKCILTSMTISFNWWQRESHICLYVWDSNQDTVLSNQIKERSKCSKANLSSVVCFLAEWPQKNTATRVCSTGCTSVFIFSCFVELSTLIYLMWSTNSSVMNFIVYPDSLLCLFISFDSIFPQACSTSGKQITIMFEKNCKLCESVVKGLESIIIDDN